MKNMSIRTRILAGVVTVNLLGTLVAMVYLHQSYSASVEVNAARAVVVSSNAYEQVQADKPIDPVNDAVGAATVLSRMNAITGGEYAFLLDKTSTDEEAYASVREAANLPDNWEEGDTYAMLATTGGQSVDTVDFNVPSGDVPEMGKTVGVENGACSETCHNGITAEGDYWAVAWSTDSKSRAHAVFPVNNASGEPIGVVYGVNDISVQADQARSSMMRTLTVIALTLLVATLTIGGMIDALVFKRMNRMMVQIEDVSIRVAGGDFDARFTPDVSNDEIGQFEQFFANVLELMTGTIKTLVEKKK